MLFLRYNRYENLILAFMYCDFYHHFSLGENTGLQKTNRNVDIDKEETDIVPESLSGNHPILQNYQILTQRKL